MARPEVPVDFTIPERGELAAKLRSLRSAKGITYKQLVENTSGKFSASHYKRAASGKELFAMDVVLAYARGCVDNLTWGQVDELYDLHLAAEIAVNKAERNERRSTLQPKPHLVQSLADLSGAMRAAWARAGRPPMRKIAKLSGIYVPHSTAHAIVTGRSVPRDLRQYLHFLEACDVAPDDLRVWIRAWVKAWRIYNATYFARDLRWMDEETRKIYDEVILELRAEEYDLTTVTRLLDRAIYRTMDSMRGVMDGEKRLAMMNIRTALEHFAEVHQYMRKTTDTTYSAIA
ncbi:hypothetical protein [Streptomyces hydrogenans]